MNQLLTLKGGLMLDWMLPRQIRIQLTTHGTLSSRQPKVPECHVVRIRNLMKGLIYSKEENMDPLEV